MAITVTQLGSGAQTVNAYGTVPPPSAWSGQLAVENTPGDWMVALLAWRQASGQTVTMSVADDAHNEWEPLGAPSGTSSASGTTRCAIWYAPAAQLARFISVAPSGPYVSLGVIVLDIAGMTPWLSLSALHAQYANQVTSLGAMTLAAPASPMIAITLCGSDLYAAQPSLSGSGWTALTAGSIEDPTDALGDLVVSGAYQVTSGSVSATWSVVSGTQDFSGVIAGLLVSGGAAPAQPNAMWPATVAEVALSAGPGTPPDQLAWTPVTARSLDFSVQQGRQYQLAALQTGSGAVALDNPDGSLIPPGSGGFAGIDSGTPFRLRMDWQGGAWQLTFAGNGTTAAPGAGTGQVFAVTPGQSYAASAYLACTPAYPAGMTLTLSWLTSGGSLISSVTSAAVAGQVAVLASVTGTAPGTAAGASITIATAGTPAAGVTFQAAAAPPAAASSGYLAIPAAVSWAAQNGAVIGTSAPWEYDVRGAPQACPNNVAFSGYIQKWPQQWDSDTQRGVVNASLVDAWNYCQGNLQPVIFAEVANEGPYAYWPCTDAAGSVQASNVAAGNANPLVIQSTKYGNGGASEAFAENSSALLGAQGTLLLSSSVRQQAQAGMWQQTLPSGVTTAPIYAQGFTASCTDGNYPSVADGVTIEFWFQVTAPFQNASGGVFESVMVVRNTTTAIFSLTIESTATTLSITQGATPASPSFAIACGTAGVDYRAMPDLQHFAIAFDQSVFNTYVNGQPTVTFQPWSPAIPATFSTLSFNGDVVQPQQGLIPGTLTGVFNCYNGYLAHVAVTPRMLSRNRVNTHYQAGMTAMTGDEAGSRIERLMEAGGYLGRRSILQPSAASSFQFATATSSCQDIAGQPASSSISNISAATTPAAVTIAPTGDVFYLSREWSYNQPVRWALGDDPANGEITYQPDDFLVDYDPQRTVNDIQLTQLDNQDIVIPNIPETASQVQYGDNTYWATGYLQGDLTEPSTFGPGLMDLANWIAVTNARPYLRPSQVTVDASANPANWPFVCQVAPGDIVTVTRRPPVSGQAYTFTGRVSQVSRSVLMGAGGTKGSATVTVDPAPEASVLTLDDPVRGLLDGTNALAW
jgi:hypothetical protein